MKCEEFINLIQGNVSGEEANLRRSTRNLKRGKPNEKNHYTFKKRTPNKDGSSHTKGNLERGCNSQTFKPSCSTGGKKNDGKILAGTVVFYGCGNDAHKVRDCATIAARGRKAKKVHPNAPDEYFCKLYFFGSNGYLLHGEYGEQWGCYLFYLPFY